MSGVWGHWVRVTGASTKNGWLKHRAIYMYNTYNTYDSNSQKQICDENDVFVNKLVWEEG